ncbi:MAG: YhcN/YlaJ family sporulation lipoprotein [Clostridia bacterium]
MTKRMLLPLALLLACAMLSGCFGGNNEAEPTATPVPMTTATATPDMNMGSMATPMSGNVLTTTPAPAGAAGPYDWKAQAAAVESRIAMFSEIEACRVVVCEGTALAGVKFTTAYQGEMTQRIRDMIAGEIMAVDNTIQVVAVTAEPKDVERIYSLSDAQKNGNPPSDLKQQVDTIARNTTTLR